MGRYRASGVTYGVGTANQTTIEQLKYKLIVEQNEMSTRDIFQASTSSWPVRDCPAAESSDDLLFVVQDLSGQYIHLAQGSKDGGLLRILAEYAEVFEALCSIGPEQVASYLARMIQLCEIWSAGKREIAGEIYAYKEYVITESLRLEVLIDEFGGIVSVRPKVV